MEALQDFWESIPMWAVALIVLIALVGLYFLFQYLALPGWMFWLAVGGVVVGGIFSVIRGLFGGGL